MPQWISDLIAVSPVLGGLVVAIFLSVIGWKYLRPPTKGLNHFLEDWNGEPSRPGVPARPGVMQRFSNIEEFTAKYGPIIDKLDHEMHPNSGSSMADAVNRTEASLRAHLESCPPQTTVNVNTGV